MDSNNSKIKLCEEIYDLSHIGRTAKDIEQALSTRGYDKLLLKEILTVKFMEKLIQKEQSFADMQQSENIRVAKKTEEGEHENLKQKSEEKQVQKQKMSEDEKKAQDLTAY